MLAFMDHMLVGLCPHLLLCFIYKTHLLKQFLIEAMDIKQPEPQESQELPEASPPQPPQATSTTSPTTTETITLEELELIRQHRATTRESSPAKTPRTDQGWKEFLTALSAMDVELSHLDFGLPQELRSSHYLYIYIYIYMYIFICLFISKTHTSRYICIIMCIC